MFAIDILKDWNGARFYTIFEHGRFHQPTMIVAENEAKHIAHYILAGQSELPHVPDDATIAAEVKRHRKSRNQSQEAAAKEIGISRTYFVLVEQGKAAIGLDVYRAIVNWMGA